MDLESVGPCILLDIEGTTTSISFVKEVLFPYARSHVTDYLLRNLEFGDKADTMTDINMLWKQYELDVLNGLSNIPEIVPQSKGDEQEFIKGIINYVQWQIDNDRKTTALKTLQGKMWKLGYENGVLRSHFFPDVPEALKRWTERNKKLYIYSSGSVDAQKLLFRYSESGDFTKYISGYFDTTSGSKLEKDSYRNVAEKMERSPEEITFFTDSTGEADAAKEAGFRVVLMERPGNPPVRVDKSKYVVATSFEGFY